MQEEKSKSQLTEEIQQRNDLLGKNPNAWIASFVINFVVWYAVLSVWALPYFLMRFYGQGWGWLYIAAIPTGFMLIGAIRKMVIACR